MSDKIRCFVAVDIPDEIKLDIESYITQLKKISPQIKWVKSNNMHVTLKFLGEIEPDLCSRVKDRLGSISDISTPFDLKISDAGVFPNRYKPRVFWLGLQQDFKKSLAQLHEWINEKLSPLGFEKEKRKFSPHLTLGRIKNPGNYDSLLEFIETNKFKEKSFKVSQIILMQSELKSSGAVYTPLQIYPL